jgi:predicted TIM-barrel fold metal-dependent hydrolase
MKAHGVKAALLYPAAQGFSPAPWCAGALYELLEAMRLPTFVRYNPSDLSWNDLHDLLATHPRLPVILRGVSYGIDRTLYALLDACPNLHVETAKYLPFRGLEEIVRRFGAARLVFGSEAPFLSPGAAVAPILTAAITDAERRAIAAGNLRRLLGGITYDG